ncbi:MAG: DNA polymerase III subunit gamma/tau [Bacilli bacterium]
MNYKVLYRKYRPNNFDELVGQETVKTLLKDSIINNKISHAYIFSGPRGTGKTSTAKIFAKAINCQNLDNGNPCGSCSSCSNFKNSSDIYEIDAASNTGVDQIREIIDNVKLTPINSKYKIYIIDEVHMLSTSAFNALLLTLEEPPSHVIFILATTNIEAVPITVLSRCQRLDFKKISDEDIINHLKMISNKENIDIDEDATKEIAVYSEGGLRDALSILDQISKLNKHISYKDVLNDLGSISVDNIDQLLDDINNNNVPEIINFINNVESLSIDYKTLVKKIINSIKKRALNIKINQKNERLTYDDYKKMCFELSDTLYKINVNVNLYSLLELILLDYVNTNFTSNDDNIKLKTTKEIDEIKQINNLNNNYYEELEKIRINNCFVDASKKYKIENTSNWEKFLDLVEDKKIKGLVEDTTVVLSSNSIIVLTSKIENMVNEINKNINIIEKKFNTMYNTNYKLIATSNKNWEIKMNEYKINLSKKISYNYIKEPEISSNYDEVSDIFDITKIEEK